MGDTTPADKLREQLAALNHIVDGRILATPEELAKAFLDAGWTPPPPEATLGSFR